MRKVAFLMLGLVVAGCAQPVPDLPRDVYGAAARGTLPPEVPKDQQVRLNDAAWKRGVMACLAGAGTSTQIFSREEAGRYCACTTDLFQTRISAARLAQMGMNTPPGTPVSPRDLPELAPIAIACWPK